MSMLVLALAIAAASNAAACPPLPGAATLFSNPRTKVVWVGEMHGTAEDPALFGDIVCAASDTRRPIVVALERVQSEQPLWNAFLASDGGPSAVAALLGGGNWPSPIQDGRSSRAMLSLAERLRRYKAEGRIAGVELMIPETVLNQSEDAYERVMARSAANAGTAAPATLVLAYSGSAHAKKGTNTFRGETYAFAADHLAPDTVVSVVIEGGPGSAWTCEDTTCGPRPYASAAVRRAGTHARGVAETGAPRGYDAVAYTGLPTSVSPPAARPDTPELIVAP